MKDRTKNATIVRRRTTVVVAAALTWHVLSRLAWMASVMPSKSGNQMDARSDIVEKFGWDSSWWTYFTTYTNKLGEVVISHYFGYCLLVLLVIVIVLADWLADWIANTQHKDELTKSLSPTAIVYVLISGLVVGLSITPGIGYMTVWLMY